MFNIEGGCYAKCINLSAEKEPEIFRRDPLRHGAGKRGARSGHARGRLRRRLAHREHAGRYPIEFIPNAKIPCVGGHPRNIILLTCDAFGVLPPVSQADARAGDVSLHQRLHGQGGRHRGGRERAGGDVLGLLRRGVPGLASDEVRRDAGRQDAAAHGARPGWSTPAGPAAATASAARIKLAYTRAIIDAIHSGQLAKAPTTTEPVFGLAIPTAVPGVPSEILHPRGTWTKPAAYDAKALHLAKLFQANFANYADQATAEVQAAGPMGVVAAIARSPPWLRWGSIPGRTGDRACDHWNHLSRN